MTRDEAKKLIFTYSESQFGRGYGSIVDAHKYTVDTIYDDFESRTCSNCKWGLEIEDKEILLCGTAVCLGLDDYGQYVVTKDFGCNKFERKG